MSRPVITHIILLTAAALFAFTSCTKKSPGSCTSSPNVVMVTDGSIYCAGSNGISTSVSSGQTDAGIMVGYFTPPFSAFPLFSVFVGKNYPFSLIIQDSMVAFSSPIAYNLFPADSNINLYKENFSGGQSYKIVGGTININNFDSSNLTANFTLHLSNPTGSKTISGLIDANHLVLK